MADQMGSILSQLVNDAVSTIEEPHTENVQQKGIDWFKQDDIYKRHMCLSYLPNDIPISDLTLLLHADGVAKHSSTISNLADEVDSTQTSFLSARKSTLTNFLRKSEIYKKARNKILSSQVDNTTRKINEPTFKASVWFRIEADSKANLESYTENIKEKADELGVEILPIEAPPEAVIHAMSPIGLIPMEEVGEKYCITLDAAAFAMIHFCDVPEELLNNLYENPARPIYI